MVDNNVADKDENEENGKGNEEPGNPRHLKKNCQPIIANFKNMYFHAVKSTAHPPIIGALGHSTDFILKQPNTVVINIYLL